MPNITLQDLTAIIHGTSSSNNDQFDLVHVETLLQTSEPLPQEMSWFVPNGSSIPPAVEEFFHAMNVAMYPTDEATILAGTEDILAEAQANQTNDVAIDASKYLLRAVMVKKTLELVMGTTNLYHLSYDYKLFHVKDMSRTYDFKVQLPFSGLAIQPGGQVMMTIILPIGSTVDADATQGIAIGGQTLQEVTTQIPNVNRPVVSFQYQNDPDFTIRYHY